MEKRREDDKEDAMHRTWGTLSGWGIYLGGNVIPRKRTWEYKKRDCAIDALYIPHAYILFLARLLMAIAFPFWHIGSTRWWIRLPHFIMWIHLPYKRYDRARTLRALFTLSRYRRNRINIIKINRKPGRRPRFGALISSWLMVTHNIIIMWLEIESSLVRTICDPSIRDNYSHRKTT